MGGKRTLLNNVYTESQYFGRISDLSVALFAPIPQSFIPKDAGESKLLSP
jgi:hypothetical protein